MATRRALFFFAFLSLWLAVANYGFTHEMIGGDGGYTWALPWQTVHHTLGIFLENHGLGWNGAARLCTLPLDVLLGLIASAGGSTVFADRVMTAFMFFLAYAGAYLLVKTLLADRAPALAIEIGALAAAAIYGANHFTAYAFASAMYDLPVTYLMLPWATLTFVYAAQGRTRQAIVLGSLVFLFGSAAGARVVTVLLVAATTILVTLLDPATRARTIRVSIPLLVLCMLLSAWWMLPYTTVVGSGLGNIDEMNLTGWLHWMSARSSLAHVFKLDGYTGGDDFPLSWWYRSFFGNLLGYWPIGLAIVGLGRRRPRLGIALFALGIIGAIMAKGTHPPLGAAYAWMIAHVPGFSIFRSPYDKWIELTCLALAVVGGFGASVIAQAATRIDRRIVTALILLPLILYPLPQYIGKLVPLPGATSYLSTIPADYATVAQIVGQKKDAVVAFQSGGGPYPIYAWRYFGEDPLESLLSQRFSAVSELIGNAATLPPHVLAAALRDFGVSWIIVHRDITNPVASPDAQALVLAGEATHVVTMHDLAVYRLSGLPAPLVRIVKRLAVPTADSIDGFSGRRNLDSASFTLEREGVADLLLKTPSNAFGSLRDAVFVPAWAGTGWAWPLIGEPTPCGANAGIVLAAPVAWNVGNVSLSPASHIFCARGRVTDLWRVDDQPVGSGLLFLSAARHLVSPSAAPPVMSVAPIQVRPILSGGPLSATFFTASVPIKYLHVTWRASCAGALTLVTPAFSASLTPPGRAIDLPETLQPGASALIYGISGKTCDGWPVQQLDAVTSTGQSLPVYPASINLAVAAPAPAVRPQGQPLVLDDRVYHFPRLPATRGTARPRVSYASLLLAQIQGFTGRAAAAANIFPARGGDIRGWSAQNTSIESASSFSMTAPDDDETADVQTAVGLDPSTRYRLTIDYSSDKDATLTISADRSYETHSYRLAAGIHQRETLLLAPAVDAATTFIFAFDIRGGRLSVERAHLEVAGPNGTWASRILMDDRPASLEAIERPNPGLIRLKMRDCSPCTLRVDVADTANWNVAGAGLLASGIGPGGGAGGLSAFSAGASVWRIKAGPGEHIVELQYRPVLLAEKGLLASLGALFLCILWWALATRSTLIIADYEEEGDDGSTVRNFRTAALWLVAAGAIASGFFPERWITSLVFDVLTVAVIVLTIVLAGRLVRARQETPG